MSLGAEIQIIRVGLNLSVAWCCNRFKTKDLPIQEKTWRRWENGTGKPYEHIISGLNELVNLKEKIVKDTISKLNGNTIELFKYRTLDDLWVNEKEFKELGLPLAFYDQCLFSVRSILLEKKIKYSIIYK